MKISILLLFLSALLVVQTNAQSTGTLNALNFTVSGTGTYTNTGASSINVAGNVVIRTREANVGLSNIEGAVDIDNLVPISLTDSHEQIIACDARVID